MDVRIKNDIEVDIMYDTSLVSQEEITVFKDDFELVFEYLQSGDLMSMWKDRRETESYELADIEFDF